MKGASSAGEGGGADGGKIGGKSINIKARVDSPRNARVTLTTYQQYADLALAVTLQDLAESGQTLDINERPAFSQNPANMVKLFPEESRERLITYVLKQYGGS